MALTYSESLNENADYTKQQMMMRSTHALCEWLMNNNLTPNINSQLVKQDAQTEDSSSITVQDSYDYLILDPQGTWDIKAILGSIEEVGGSFGLDWQIQKTNNEDAAGPATNSEDWSIVDSGSISADGQVDFVDSINAEKVAVGVKNSTAGNNAEAIRLISGTANVEMTNIIQSLENRLGDTTDSAAGHDSTGTLIAQIRQVAKAIGDEATASKESDTSVAATVIERLTALAGALDSDGTDTLQTEQQTPVGVENTGNTQIDPATEQTLNSLAQSLKTNDSDELVARITGSDGKEIAEVSLGSSLGGSETALITYLSQALTSVGDDDVRVNLVSDNLSGDLDVDDSAVGDESTASQQADSTTAATVIQRLTALVDVLASGQSDDELRTLDATESQDSTTGHSTQTSWQNVAILDTADTDHWKECRPYVKDTSAGGSTTDARLLMALDPNHSAASDESGDAPTGSVSDGDGWVVVDSALSDNSEAIASGGDWPEIASGYEVDSHLLVLQVQQGSGQEIVDALLNADKAK